MTDKEKEPPIVLPHFRFPDFADDSPPEFLPPVDDPEVLRVLAIGSRTVVNIFVHRVHQAGIVHYSEWSRLLPTPNPDEFMRILTKRIPLDRSDQN